MGRTRRQVNLTADERRELITRRDTDPKAYIRERCAAILKVADGMPAAHVARNGLLKQRDPDTVYDWLNRYRKEGAHGLTVRKGRGRKPAFFPSLHG